MLFRTHPFTLIWQRQNLSKEVMSVSGLNETYVKLSLIVILMLPFGNKMKILKQVGKTVFIIPCSLPDIIKLLSLCFRTVFK